jgi:hypothetical protein
VGLRARLKPAPLEGELPDRMVHEIVRDLPEALAVFLGAGIDTAVLGDRLLRDLDGGKALAKAIARASAWRPAPPGTPSTGTSGGPAGEPMAESAAPRSRPVGP